MAVLRHGFEASGKSGNGPAMPCRDLTAAGMQYKAASIGSIQVMTLANSISKSTVAVIGFCKCMRSLCHGPPSARD